ncbi:MAG: oxygen-independent coproporphyrinogen III oxidase [Pseudomonadota bacterium]
MRTAWQKYLTLNVPRYTSYPSALQFTNDVGGDEHARSLRAIGEDEPVSLYVHIPFCRQLCYYCGCNMRVENSDRRIRSYVDDLIDEIAIIGGTLSGRNALSHIHFGGGTPNILAGEDVERLLTAVEAVFDSLDTVPIAMEVDPRLSNADQITDLVELGVTRFSIGVQDLDPQVQKAINRIQPLSMVEACMRDLRHAGVSDISLDVLYGLPHQTLCTFRRTIDEVVKLAPDRVSLFGYAHMPSKLPHQRLIPEEMMPARSLRHVLAEDAALRLESAGYERIGFDHFARPGTAIAEAAKGQRLNRNFQGFTEDQAGIVIGVGASAISSVHGLIVQNEKNLPAYRDKIARGQLPVAKGVVASARDQDIGEWLKRLLCDMRGSMDAYLDAIDGSGAEQSQVMERLLPLVADDVVAIEGDDIVIHPDARPLARVVAATFDPYALGQSRFASPAV